MGIKGGGGRASASGDAPSSISVGASPFVHQNTSAHDVSGNVVGGVVTALAWSRDNSTYYNVGALTSGMVWLSPGDYVKVTYSSAPTMTNVPR